MIVGVSPANTLLVDMYIDMVNVIANATGYNGSEPTKPCPNCGVEKPYSDFGWRDMGNDNIRVQSWCKDCR